MGGSRVPGITCWWCDISNCLGDHVSVVFGGFNESAFGYLRRGGLVHFSIPFYTMSLSEQHPYTLFVASRLRSPSLAKAQLEVGDNANSYLASVDVVFFIGPAQSSPPIAGCWVYSRNGVC